jgi:rod shape-determining protein MreC
VAVISSQQNSYQNSLFAKNKHSSLGFVLAIMISLTLIFTDAQLNRLSYFRFGVSLLVTPLQYVVDYPMNFFGWITTFITDKRKLIDENTKLHYQQTVLEAQLQKLLVLRDENVQLKALLSNPFSAKMTAMAAQILSVDTTKSRQILVLNKGKRDGIFVGLPVLDAKGVMGQIIDVGLMTSTVLLISDAKSSVPIKNNRTGERAILVGINKMNELSLINLPNTSEIMKGDLLVTSGLGRRYPEGFPVGQVDDVKRVPGDDFMKVTVSPIALLNRNRLVLVVWPEEEHDELTQQIDERMTIMDRDYL